MRKLFIALTVVIAVTSVQASYLYWTIGDTITMDNTGSTYTLGELSNSGVEYIGAVLHQVYNGTDTPMTYGTIGGNGQFVSSGTSLATPSAGSYTDGNIPQYLVDLGNIVSTDQGAYSYYIEYIGYNASTGQNSTIGMGETKTYSQLASSIVDYDAGLSPITPASVWHGGTANAPEPTSAMLMLLGVAGLALRRKQRKSEE